MLRKITKLLWSDGFLATILILVIGPLIITVLAFGSVKFLNWMGFYRNSAIAVGILLLMVLGALVNDYIRKSKT